MVQRRRLLSMTLGARFLLTFHSPPLPASLFFFPFSHSPPPSSLSFPSFLSCLCCPLSFPVLSPHVFPVPFSCPYARRYIGSAVSYSSGGRQTLLVHAFSGWNQRTFCHLHNDFYWHFTVSKNWQQNFCVGLGRHGNVDPTTFGRNAPRMESAAMVWFSYEMQFGYWLQKRWSQTLSSSTFQHGCLQCWWWQICVWEWRQSGN